MLNVWFRTAAMFMLTGVVLGAFGAHGLKARLTPEAMQIYQTAVFYHFIHAIGLFIVAWVVPQLPPSRTRLAGLAFGFGIILFSGSLYLLSVTGMRWLGALTPIGGVLFILGWAVLALGV